jgi:hypothetical protein
MKKATIKQAGRIVCEGQLQMRFWVRALNLEKEVAYAQGLINEKSERKWGLVPTIGEYRVDERFLFLYALLIDVDQLGVKGGTGVIFYTSPEREKEVYEVRDALADDVLKNIPKETWDETVVMEDKREGDRSD